MHTFAFERARDAAHAIQTASAATTAQQGAEVRFLAGGTTVLDLMKLDVEQPARLVDLAGLGLDQIEPTGDGGLRIGAMVRNADLAHDARVQRDYPVLSQALLAGASGQLRNMATTGGNLLQRTRCVYFRDTRMPCNKREPGTGCPAQDGFNRNLAILGTSDHCIASNPSDMNVALAALDARIHVQGPAGERVIAMNEFHVQPGDTPHQETVLAPGDLITHVVLPAPAAGAGACYLKLRDRASYEFALASAAVVAHVAQGRLAQIRIALGGVGTVPWRARLAEAALQGQAPSEQALRAAADQELAAARPREGNRFKIELARRCLIQAVLRAIDTAEKTPEVA